MNFLGFAIMYLIHRQIEETLNQIINSLSYLFYKSHNSLAILFKNKLLEVGYFKEHQVFYDTTYYNITNTTYYKIEEGFPRLIPSNLPLGVEEVKYVINLNLCQAYQINEFDLFQKTL